VPARFPYGVLGVFLVLLGAGMMLDGDWTLRGGALVLGGAALLALERRQP
jgi:hypothetical protein